MMVSCAQVICAALFAATASPYTLLQRDLCNEVIVRAMDRGLDGPGVAALAWSESRFTAHAKSAAGAVGVLQIIPKYWCSKKREDRCDVIESGLDAYEHYVSRSKKYLEGICRYNSGRSCKRSNITKRYAEAVESLMVEVKERIMFTSCSEDGC